jgi:hypothetical protein
MNEMHAAPARGARRPARETEGGGARGAQCRCGMERTGSRSQRRAPDVSRPGKRKAPRVMGSCSPAEWGLPCNGVSRAQERDRSRVEKRSEERGRKAEGLFGGPLALEGGKGRQARAHVPKRNMKFPRLLWGLGKERGTDRNRRVYYFPSSRPLSFPHIVTKQANAVREGRAEASQITQ